jgi:peptidylprolyl isomerase
MSERPIVEPHLGPAPEVLVIEDLTLGEGEEAKTGQTAVVHYVGVSASSGAEFDASWNRGEPFDFTLGAGHVIKGWDEGVVGMRVGGRRRLVIPSHLGYGERGAGGVIAPNETLIFVVDLLELR